MPTSARRTRLMPRPTGTGPQRRSWFARLGRVLNLRHSLAERVRRNLARHGASLRHLEIEADGGRVTLRGVPRTAADRDLLLRVVEGTRGVRAVHDRTEVGVPATEASTEQPGAPVAPGDPLIYVVRRGDTLEGISQRLLGRAAGWNRLYQVNRDIIDDPRLLYPGMRLRVPERR